MNVILSWVFLFLSPISLLGVMYITFKKLKGSTIAKLLLGVLLGTPVAFLMYLISTFIGMNFY